MKTGISLCLLAIGLGLAGCSDTVDDPDASILLRGHVMTGAHPATRVALAGGYVDLLAPSNKGWVHLKFATTSGIPNKAVVSSDGWYTFKIDTSFLSYTSYYPLFLAASDSGGTFTMLAPIPLNGWTAGEQIALDINPTTTAAAQMICPGGVYPASSPAYCYTDPNATTDYPAAETAIDDSLAGPDASVSTGSPPDWQTFMTSLLNGDGTLLPAIGQIFWGSAGSPYSGFSKTAIPSAIANPAVVSAPVAGVDDNGTISSGGDGSSGGGCQLDWNCHNVQQCVELFGTNTGSYPEPDATTCNNFVSQSCSGGACSCSGC